MVEERRTIKTGPFCGECIHWINQDTELPYNKIYDSVKQCMGRNIVTADLRACGLFELTEYSEDSEDVDEEIEKEPKVVKTKKIKRRETKPISKLKRRK